MRNCTKLFGADKTGCWREALVTKWYWLLPKHKQSKAYSTHA